MVIKAISEGRVLTEHRKNAVAYKNLVDSDPNWEDHDGEAVEDWLVRTLRPRRAKEIVNYHWAKDPVASSEAQVHQTQPQKWELRSIGHDTCGGPHHSATLSPRLG